MVGDGGIRALPGLLRLHGFYDLDTDSPWTPYLGAGLGWALVGYEVDAFGGPFIDDDDGVFGFQAMAGVAYEIQESLQISFGYRFFGTANPEFTDELQQPFESEYLIHAIEVGLRIGF